MSKGRMLIAGYADTCLFFKMLRRKVDVGLFSISKFICLICCYMEKSVFDFLLSRAAHFLIYRFVESCMCGYMFDRILFVEYAQWRKE